MSTLNKGGPLPDVYWVENPEPGKSDSMFCKMLQEIVKERFFKYSYYKIEGAMVIHNTDAKPSYDDILYTFEEWKAALTGTGIQYKVGDWVIPLNDSGYRSTGTVYKIKSLDMDGIRLYKEDGSTDGNGWYSEEDIRPATSEEIQKATGQSSPVQDYSVQALMNKKIVVHCETEKEWEQCTSLIPNNRLFGDWGISSEDSAFQVDQYGGSHSKVSYFRENGFQVITAQQFLAANTLVQSNIPVTEDNVYVGMKIVRGKDWHWMEQDGGSGNTGTVIERSNPGWYRVKWLNIEKMQTYRVGSEGEHDLYTAPGETNKATINQLINNQPKTKQHDKEQQEHTGTAVNLSANPSTVCKSDRRAATPVRQSGQPILTIRGHRSNSKAVGVN